jgi:hypothetical protein
MEKTILDMSILAATVEIMKAEISSQATRGSLLLSGTNRDEVIKNIEVIYKKFYELEYKKEWKIEDAPLRQAVGGRD